MSAERIKPWIDRLAGVRDLPGQEAQARALVLDLLALAAEAPSNQRGVWNHNPQLCPDCGLPVLSEKSPYCCDRCRSEAALVRQMRQSLETGEFDEEKQVAFGQSLWRLYGGGYPLRQSMIPEKARAKVIEKAGGLCAACGKPATTVDHVKTACNRPINLRPVCDSCNLDRPFFEPAILDGAIGQSVRTEIGSRIGAAQPLRLCDDANTWDWRAYLAERKKLGQER